MKFRSKAFYTFVVLAIVYASVNLLAAPPRTTLQRYHLSSSSLHLLNATVVVPVIAIWFTGLYGYQKLRSYTKQIQNTKDGKLLLSLTRGVMLLAFWLPISSTVSALLSLFAREHPGWLPAVTIVVNYLTLLFPLFAFSFISRSAWKLSNLSKSRPPRGVIDIIALILLTGGVFYGYLITNAQSSIHTIYHMPLALVLTTLVIPYLYSWYLGLLSAHQLHTYAKNVKGIIYRKSWNALAIGIIWIILFSICLQYLTTVSAKLSNLSLGWVLVLIYTLLPLMAVGYVFVAIGAKRLNKIEEV